MIGVTITSWQDDKMAKWGWGNHERDEDKEGITTHYDFIIWLPDICKVLSNGIGNKDTAPSWLSRNS